MWRQDGNGIKPEEDMMTIVRWDAFRNFGVAAANTWEPPVDIYQSGDHELVLTAELPDLSRENIDITVENFVLTVKGEKKFGGDVKEEQFHHIERHYGTFTRSFSLPQTVDAGKVSAEYKNGVLTVRLPLREEARPRQIKVDVAA
jgi:HSP20 family protein